MSDLTRNLVDAIISGKATAIEDSFQAAMSDKISSAMEARKVVLAQGLFRESIEELGEADEVFAKVPKSKRFVYGHKVSFRAHGKEIVGHVSDSNPTHAKVSVRNPEKGDPHNWSVPHKHLTMVKDSNKARAELTKEELTLEDYSIEEIEEFMMSEEFQSLDEVSKKTLGSYVTKAHDQLMKHTAASNFKSGRGDADAFAYSRDEKTMRKEKNRKAGVATAIGKMTKEEVEELDELSKATLGSYIKKATTSAIISGEALGKGEKWSKSGQIASKREKGIGKAVDKMTKEEVELDEVSQGTLDSYRKKSFDEPGEKREAGRKLAFAKSAGTSGDAKVSATEFVTKAKSEIKDLIKPEHHAKYPISKITGYNAAHKIYKDASAAGHLKEEVEELDD